MEVDAARGGPEGGGVAEYGVAENGVVGAEAVSLGTRFERTRMGGFLGGPSVKSIAVAGRPGGTLGADAAGDTV